MTTKYPCLNCGQEAPGNFCPKCGQRQQIPRLTFAQITADFFSSAFNLDAPYPKTVYLLLISPGRMINDYLKGNRRPYYAPVRFIILSLFLFILLENWLDFDFIQAERHASPNSSNPWVQASYFMIKYLNYFILILPFCIAFISKVFFWKKPLNMAERTAMGFFMAGEYILLASIPLILAFLSNELVRLRYPITVLYFSWVFYNMFLGNSKIKTGIKSLLAGFLSMIVYFTVSYGIAFVLVHLFKPSI